MIIINEDKAIKKDFVKYKSIRYKGQMSNTLLVIEDVIDMSLKNPGNHRCICKCLRCGKIYPKTVSIRQIREKTAKCFCSGQHKRYKFFDKKGTMLKFLVAERNKARNEMVFAEDANRVENFDLLISFLESKSLANYFRKGLDMDI